MLLGVDTGGTFTDFVLYDGENIRLHKVLSTPAAPEQAILQGIDELGLAAAVQAGELVLVHGTTVATNAALEGKGVKTVFITNRGFADVLSMGRQQRDELYSLVQAEKNPPVPAELCLEVNSRVSAKAEVLESVSTAELEQLVEQVSSLQPEAVAVSLLFSFLNNEDELKIKQRLQSLAFVSISSEVLPEYREYERGMACWLNSWLGPKISDYMHRLKSNLAPSPVTVMLSSAGTMAASQAKDHAVRLLLSGPAGGLAATAFLATYLDQKRFLTFDMGGTSTDVSLYDGKLELTRDASIAGYPVAVPMVDIHTIGAGGGSIAWIDKGGMLCVGPESAGADPGPACYGKGGSRPTVSDANVVLGRLRPEAFLGGSMSLDVDAARGAVQTIATPLGLSVEQAAEGIIRLANEHMARALRAISVQRGYDPAGFSLCCFGGAGGLHVCALAEALGMQRAVLPVYGGVFSALGLLAAPRQRQMSKTWVREIAVLDEAELLNEFDQLFQQARDELLNEGVPAESLQQKSFVELRYRGQSHALDLEWQGVAATEAAFHQLHQQRKGHRLDLSVELVGLRVDVFQQGKEIVLPELFAASGSNGSDGSDVVERSALKAGDRLEGPLLITEQVSTSYVAQGWQVTVDRWGNLLLGKDLNYEVQ